MSLTRIEASARRGRPLRLAVDHSPFGSIGSGPEVRAAWLLATSRIHASPPYPSGRVEFAHAISRLGISADPSRLSRWESGAQPVSLATVGAYERALGLGRGTMSAAIAHLQPTPRPATPGRSDNSVSVHARLDDLFEQIHAAEHSGHDWGELVKLLTSFTAIYMRSHTWAQVCDQLLGELTRSAGLAQVRRELAAQRMLRHPVAGPHLLHAVGELVTQPGAQLLARSLGLVAAAEGDQARVLLLRILAGPDRALRQAVIGAVARQLTCGPYDLASLRTLERTVVRLWCEDVPYSRDTALIDLIARLPEASSRRVMSAMPPDARRLRLEAAVESGELGASSQTRPLARSIAAQVQRRTTGAPHPEPDRMLARLIREGLFHSHHERRRSSSLILAASPYAEAIGRACVELSGIDDEAVALRAVSMLIDAPQLAISEHTGLVELAVSSRHDRVRAGAIACLGHHRAPLTDELALYFSSTSASSSREVRDAVLQLLGLHASPLLAEIATSSDERASTIAAWWLRVGGAVHDAE